MPKKCRQCGAEFEITEEETQMRERIGATFETGPVPEPTQCPDCRMMRRMAWRNERNLYMRTCDKSGKSIISIYPQEAMFPVYERAEWFKDDWDALDYGQEFDFSRPFFEQFQELLNKVPRAALNAHNVENCDFSNSIFDSRNCYLCFSTYKSESLLYCYWALECKDNVDCNYIFQCERCFDCTDCNHSYGCVSCELSHNCSDSYFLYDCRGCHDCFGCVGLRKKSFFMFNEQLSKEEYQKRLNEIDFEDRDLMKSIQKKVKFLKGQHPHLYSIQDKTEDCTGDYIFESKNCKDCFQIYRSRDCLYVQDSETNDCLDGYHVGWSEATYEVYSPVRHSSTAFCSQTWDGSDNFYLDNCQSCSHCFGCCGLSHKKYCILNKQYSEEEYKTMLPRIVEHMKSTGEWGEFFPISTSPFGFNETMAFEFYPFTKEKALANGWGWRDPDKKEYQPATYELPDKIADVPDSILNEILACEKCSKNYKIIQLELDFYRDKGFSLPRECPDCRYKRRQALRNPRVLWQRNCDKCGKGVKSTYSSDREEMVYCEECYLREVY